jgi:hypothetical protein
MDGSILRLSFVTGVGPQVSRNGKLSPAYSRHSSGERSRPATRQARAAWLPRPMFQIAAALGFPLRTRRLSGSKKVIA